MDVGNGKSLQIAIDPFIGDNGNFKLPVEILNHIANLGMVILNQIKRPWWSILNGGYWINSKDIGLYEGWADIWDNYINLLNNACIRLGNSKDKITWVWNKYSRHITTKDAYEAIVSNQK